MLGGEFARDQNGGGVGRRGRAHPKLRFAFGETSALIARKAPDSTIKQFSMPAHRAPRTNAMGAMHPTSPRRFDPSATMRRNSPTR
jgi:hypothetical protein